PSHVRSYSEQEWRRMLERAGLEVEESRIVEKSGPLDQWLALVGCDGSEADEVCSLIPHRIRGNDVTTSHVLLRARKVQ
ncbi:MAG: hypothetical protein QOH73_602, partial [Gaiellaceae bacterium]|nr:hypothetical protein [Gaiellaceae bacterium]